MQTPDQTELQSVEHQLGAERAFDLQQLRCKNLEVALII